MKGKLLRTQTNTVLVTDPRQSVQQPSGLSFIFSGSSMAPAKTESAPAAKRGRGRPKGSVKKTKTKAAAKTAAKKGARAAKKQTEKKGSD